MNKARRGTDSDSKQRTPFKLDVETETDSKQRTPFKLDVETETGNLPGKWFSL